MFHFWRALIDGDEPAVSAVTGAAIGIGATMLLRGDFVDVFDEARIAMPFASLELVPEFASSVLVSPLHRRRSEKHTNTGLRSQRQD